MRFEFILSSSDPVAWLNNCCEGLLVELIYFGHNKINRWNISEFAEEFGKFAVCLKDRPS